MKKIACGTTLLLMLLLQMAARAADCSNFTSPPKYAEGVFGDVIFCLDSSRAWAVLNDTDRNIPSLAMTRDRGKTWTVRYLEQSMYVPVSIFFLDKKHGWLTLSWALSTVNSPAYKLMQTRDAGVTWVELPSPPGAQGLFFTSVRSGCVITEPGSNSHWITKDGGQTWRQLVGEGCP